MCRIGYIDSIVVEYKIRPYALIVVDLALLIMEYNVCIEGGGCGDET